MTEQEAIKYLKDANRNNQIIGIFPKSDIGKCLINALEEVQKYRAIGTVEECRAAVEKQTAAKPLGGKDIEGNEYAICRECSAILSDGEWFAQYCPDCGKKVDWREKE